MKLINYLAYGMRDTFRSLSRHVGIVLISILSIAITLSILGSSVLVALNSEYATMTMEDELEIVVFLHKDVTREAALGMSERFQTIDGFASAVFVPQEEALEAMNTRFSAKTNLGDALGGRNPLPDAYHIKVTDAYKITDVVAVLEKVEGVETVRYGKEVVENMLIFSETIAIAGAAVVIAMVIAALFLVNSTIRLTVLARSQEIHIMKFVGATNAYIRVPFFLEGIIIGLLGALIADLGIYFGYGYLVEYVSAHINFLPILDDPLMLYQILGGLLLGGALLGALGSIIAVRKHLKV